MLVHDIRCAFPTSACSSFSGLAWVVIACPRKKAVGQGYRHLGWKEHTGCVQQGKLVMRTPLFEWHALQYMWQEDLVNVTKLITKCLDKIYAPAAGPSHISQAF